VRFSDFLIPMLASMMIHGICFLSVPPGTLSAQGAPGDVQRVHVRLVPGGWHTQLFGASSSWKARTQHPRRTKRVKLATGSKRMEVREKGIVLPGTFDRRREEKRKEEGKGKINLRQQRDLHIVKGRDNVQPGGNQNRSSHTHHARRAGGDTGKEMGRGQFVPPEIVGMEKPEYPPSSRWLGEEGVVVLSVVIDAEGKGKHVKVVKTSGYDRLDRSARKALIGATFSPATVAGVPVESRKRVSVRFLLKEYP